MADIVTVDDFFTGLFAALALKGRITLSTKEDRLDKALTPVFRKLLKGAPERGLDIRFRILADPFHGDSIVVRNAVYSAAQRDLVSLDNPEFQSIRLKLRKEVADRIIDRVPGGRQLYCELADDLLKQYDAVAP